MTEPTEFELLELATPYALHAVSDAERAAIDRQLAAAAGDHLPRRADPVAEVEVLAHHPGVRLELRVAHQELYGPAPVVDGGEDQLAVAPDRRDPAGDPDLRERST